MSAGPRYRLVIFDYDGTLCATHDAVCYSIRLAFGAYGINSPSDEQILEVIRSGCSLSDTMQRLHPKREIVDAEMLDRLVTSYRESYASGGSVLARVYDDANNTFQSLHRSGISIVVMSNKGETALTYSLRESGLLSFVSLVIGDNASGMPGKPDPAAYHALIRPRFPTALACETIIVGDTHADLLFARNTAIDSCWARYGYGDPAKCNDVGYRFSIQTINEIVPIVVDKEISEPV
jgi:phosphoglycolate phosphatase